MRRELAEPRHELGSLGDHFLDIVRRSKQHHDSHLQSAQSQAGRPSPLACSEVHFEVRQCRLRTPNKGLSVTSKVTRVPTSSTVPIHSSYTTRSFASISTAFLSWDQGIHPWSRSREMTCSTWHSVLVSITTALSMSVRACLTKSPFKNWRSNS